MSQSGDIPASIRPRSPVASDPAGGAARRGMSQDLTLEEVSHIDHISSELGRRSPGASPEAPAFVDTFPAHVRAYPAQPQRENIYRSKTMEFGNRSPEVVVDVVV